MTRNDDKKMNRTNENDKLAYVKPAITTFSEKELSASIQAYGNVPLPPPPSTS